MKTKTLLSSLALLAVLTFVGSSSTDVAKVDPGLSNSAAGTVALDLNDTAVKALAAFAQAKAGNADVVWSLQNLFYGEQAYVKGKADVEALVQLWTGDDTLANKLADSFGETSGTTAERMIALARKVTDTAAAFTK